jgi:mannose-6-phosphate isomerase class I
MQGNDVTTTVVRLARQLAGQPRPLELIGCVQPYAWGGFDYLRALTGLDLPTNTPAAEWWIGAHPVAPSMVRSELGDVALDRLIAHDPATTLGNEVVARFGPQLPFLLKVLDVREMLSIQAHPSKAQAEAGFARENAEGVPVDAPRRNYRDANHKPEAQVALTPFWMLCGFRHPADLHTILASRPELEFLSSHVSERLASGADQVMLDKENVRQWLIREKGFSGHGPLPVIPEDVRVRTAELYLGAYAEVTGTPLKPVAGDVEARIRKNLQTHGYL